MESCFLCLEINNDLGGSIKVNSTQWQEFNIERLIEKHLLHMEAIPLSSWLCATCWQELYQFHNFYTRVQEAHKEIGSVKKIEVANGSHFELEITMKETLLPELIIEEQKIIKEEHNEDLWEDDTPLMKLNICKRQATTRTNIGETIVKDPLKATRKLKRTKTTKIKTKKNESSKNAKGPKEMPIDIESIEQHKTNLDPSLLGICEDPNNIENSDTDSNYEPNTESTTNNENKSCKPNNLEKDKFIAENFKIICSICQTSMKTFQELCIHFKQEHEQRGFATCCSRKFFKRTNLLDHVHQHLDPNYLKCNQCDKVMANRRCLKFHKKTHDTEREKNHCCDICGLRFLTSHVLNNHKTRHFSEEEKLFPCSECGKNFGTKWTLLNHVNLVHESTISCDICGLLLANKSVLNRHKNLKHPVGEKQVFTCHICSKTSANLHAHQTHVKRIHQMEYNHKCSFCEKAFKKAQALMEHMATHTGTDLYTCTWCPKMFKSNAYMYKHRKKCHPKEWEEEIRKKYSGNLPANNKPSSADIVDGHAMSL